MARTGLGQIKKSQFSNLGNFMGVGNTNVTVTNLENVNRTGLLPHSNQLLMQLFCTH
jgi:hypothetical protein